MNRFLLVFGVLVLGTVTIGGHALAAARSSAGRRWAQP